MKKILLLIVFLLNIASLTFAVKPVAKEQIKKDANTQLLITNPNAAGVYSDITEPSFYNKVQMTIAKVKHALVPEGDDKTTALIAHITIFGWLVALILNQSKPSSFTAFYLRQLLGIFLVGLLGVIPVVGILFGLLALIMWVVSLINVLGGNQKPVFLLGKTFQKWFAGMFE